MIEWTTLSAFIAVVIGLFLIPGPAVFLTITQAAHSGRKTGILTGLGIATGDFLHVIFAAIGLSAILMTSAFAFNVVKYVGAAYLLYMGIRALFAKAEAVDLPEARSMSGWRAFRQGVVVEILNPKTALFFLAFFPQFVSPANGSTVVQFLYLGTVFIVMGFIYTTILAIGTDRISRFLTRSGSRFGQWGGKAVGLVYIGIGLRFVFQGR